MTISSALSSCWGPGSALYGPNSANGVMHIITRSPLDQRSTNVNVGLGERSVRRFSARRAGKIGGTSVINSPFSPFRAPTGSMWTLWRPEIATMIYRGRQYGYRIDYRPNDDLMAVVSGRYNQASNIEMTGLGQDRPMAGLAVIIRHASCTPDFFFQAFQNWTDAGDTFLLRSRAHSGDKSTLTVLQLQHS